MQLSRARSPHGTVATHSEWLPAPGRMGTASPTSPRRVGVQRSRTVRNLRTDRAHRITTSDHILAAQNGTSGVLACVKHARYGAAWATPRTGVQGRSYGCSKSFGASVPAYRCWRVLAHQ